MATNWKKLKLQQDSGAEISDDDDIGFDAGTIENVSVGSSRTGKQTVSIRLDPEVVRFFKSMGPGYQTKINEVLAEFVRAQKNNSHLNNSQLAWSDCKDLGTKYARYDHVDPVKRMLVQEQSLSDESRDQAIQAQFILYLLQSDPEVKSSMEVWTAKVREALKNAALK